LNCTLNTRRYDDDAATQVRVHVLLRYLMAVLVLTQVKVVVVNSRIIIINIMGIIVILLQMGFICVQLVCCGSPSRHARSCDST
jgi:hypothetical protein